MSALGKIRRSSKLGGLIKLPMVIEFSDEVINAIAATLPPDTDPARLALLPELLRVWATEHLPEYSSWEPRAEVRQREKQLRALGAKAQELIDAIAGLDEGAFFATAIEPQMLRDGTSLVRTDFAAARRRRDAAIKWLVELALIFNKSEEISGRKPKRPPDKMVLYYLLVRDLAAIYEMVTERPATRRVDWDSNETYGPFWDFLKQVWPQIFGSDAGPSYPIRVWADEMTRQRNAINAEIDRATSELSRSLDEEEREAIASGIKENSTFLTNLGLRHPELWRKLIPTDE
jgi:hypothetical protein